MNKIVMIIFIISTALVMTAPSYCEDAPKIMTIDGNVVSADWVNSSLTVKWFHELGEVEFEEETLLVPQDAKITKGEDSIGLMDIEVGDHVIVEYYEKLEMPTAKSIIVKE